MDILQNTTEALKDSIKNTEEAVKQVQEWKKLYKCSRIVLYELILVKSLNKMYDILNKDMENINNSDSLSRIKVLYDITEEDVYQPYLEELIKQNLEGKKVIHEGFEVFRKIDWENVK